MTPTRKPRPLDAGARALLALALLASLPACGDDGAQAASPEPDASEQPHDAGAPDARAVDDAATPAPVCRVSMCRESAVGTPGCCTVAGTGVAGDPLQNTGRSPGLCGTDIGTLVPSLAGICLQLEQPGRLDSDCPAQAALEGGARMPGCCTDEGYCGSLETTFGFGCFYGTGRKGLRCTPDSEEDAGR